MITVARYFEPSESQVVRALLASAPFRENRMRWTTRTGLVLLALGAAACAHEETRVDDPAADRSAPPRAPHVAVTLGAHGDPLRAACPTLAEISADTLIRNAPVGDASFIVPIAKGVRVFVCDASPDGPWAGVVVAIEGKDCGVSAPVRAPTPYDGPCASGWIPEDAYAAIAD